MPDDVVLNQESAEAARDPLLKFLRFLARRVVRRLVDSSRPGEISVGGDVPQGKETDASRQYQ